MLQQLARVCIRWGAIASILAISLMITMYYLGRHPLMIAPFLDFRILLYAIFIFFALREFRDYHQQGALYFWQGMIGSFILVGVAGILSATLFWWFGTLETEFIPSYVSQMTEYLKNFSGEDIQRIGKEVFESNLQSLPSTNMAQLASLYLAQSFVIGLFVSIILSVILRKQPKTD
ncbi:DUF4199 domain-containing protein [Oscillatoria amoena NRMC-F 0135]|nr:DUF4199 domain-containing protein [Oscillatoria amoena NRMC-F 0135]